jgi:hypothetical protein
MTIGEGEEKGKKEDERKRIRIPGETGDCV